MGVNVKGVFLLGFVCLQAECKETHKTACLFPSPGTVKWSVSFILKVEKKNSIIIKNYFLAQPQIGVTRWVSLCKQFPICKMDPRVFVCMGMEHG